MTVGQWLAWTGLCTTLWAVSPAEQDSSTYLQKARSFHTVDEFKRTAGERIRMVRSLDRQRLIALLEAGIQLPSLQLTVIADESPTITWIGTRQGALRVDGESGRREYFGGKRWLPDDAIAGIGFGDDAIWVETGQGFSKIEYRRMTLLEKSRVFVDRIQRRHNRWGLTADSQLQVAGDLASNRPRSSDNDGLWTAMYVAAEAFRYKVTGESDARENARRGMQAILRLENITGIPGFPARSFIKVGADLQPGDGQWHDTPDKQWRWKGDTSSDEIVGHYFVYPIYHELVADQSEKQTLSSTLDRITNHILDNKYQLVDADGQRTRWGWWGPDAIWSDPDETGLRALHILAHLRVAIRLTSDAKYRAKYQSAYDELTRTHKYHLLTRNQKIMVPGSINHSDDELAFLSYYPLLRYETDETLKEVYRASLERSWRIERPERNPLWNVIYAVGTGATDFDRAASVRTLQEIPTDMIQWTVKNSHRLDVPIDPIADRFKRRQALIVLPYDELPMSKWNGNPYNLDGGNNGDSEDDGAYFLLPYWMGRYHQLITN